MPLLLLLFTLLLSVQGFAQNKKLECAPVQECQSSETENLQKMIKGLKSISEEELYYKSYFELARIQHKSDIEQFKKNILELKQEIKANAGTNTEALKQMKVDLVHYEKLLKDYQDGLKKVFSDSSNLKEFKAFSSSHMKEMIAEIKSRPMFRDCGLSDLEIMAVAQYTSAYYVSINSILRNQNPDELKKIGPYLQFMKSGLSKIAPYTGMTQRGTTLPQKARAEYCQDCTLTDLAFMSTSPDHPWEGEDSFLIQSKQGRYIAPLSYSPEEEEVLFMPGEKFRVTKIVEGKKDGAKQIVYTLQNINEGKEEISPLSKN